MKLTIDRDFDEARADIKNALSAVLGRLVASQNSWVENQVLEFVARKMEVPRTAIKISPTGTSILLSGASAWEDGRQREERGNRTLLEISMECEGMETRLLHKGTVFATHTLTLTTTGIQP